MTVAEHCAIHRAHIADNVGYVRSGFRDVSCAPFGRPAPLCRAGAQIRASPRSARRTRIETIAMIRASSMTPAATTKARENPVASAWW